MTDDDYMSAAITVVRSGGKPMVPCKTCGMKFQLTKQNLSKRYCSVKCRVAASRRKKIVSDENNA